MRYWGGGFCGVFVCVNGGDIPAPLAVLLHAEGTRGSVMGLTKVLRLSGHFDMPPGTCLP